MTRDLIVLAALLCLVVVAGLVDLLAFPRTLVPAAVYAVPSVVAARLLSPPHVALVAGLSIASEGIVGWLQDGPSWLLATYFFGVCFVGYLAVSLSSLTQRAREEKASAEQYAEPWRAATEEARRARLRAEERAAVLNTMIESMPIGVIVYDPEGRITRMNDATRRILGYSEVQQEQPLVDRLKYLKMETTSGQPFSEEDVPITRVLRGASEASATFVVRSRGEPVWVSMSTAPVRDEADNLIAAVGTFMDVTPIHRLHEQQSDLLRTLSHDLRSPLTAVLGYAQMIQQYLNGAGADARILASAEAIITGANQINRMIGLLVEVSRLEGGQVELKTERLGLGIFLPELLHRLGTSLDTARVQLRVPEDLPMVEADPAHLERICTNLISNALKYSSAGTPVTLSAEQRGRFVMVTVADEGPGILPENLKHVFEKFYRAREKTAERQPEGLGLGLYSTKLLVESHGGQVFADSRPGQGSRFHFTLPVAAV